ncbi:hypothetical protein L1D31_05485 [Vibrio sp. Isolate23]|uniref:hypothetical protein n=1 Tax=Vibrio sp. Isolate23 TaxID=2908533 RepID=UPI001EFE30DD|nr:hypothetical protein [Vibrio sp. Isolate23]MCG9682016.1 hypothetical protein [Vibrio sp. Isolate23]
MNRNRSNSEPLPNTNPLQRYDSSSSISSSRSLSDDDEQYERSANGLYFVDKQNREVLYGLKTAKAPEPAELYEHTQVVLEGIDLVNRWRPRVRLFTKLEGAKKQDDFLRIAYQVIYQDKKYILINNDCALFAQFLQCSMDEKKLKDEVQQEVNIGTQISHTYTQGALGIYGESEASCKYHSVTAVATDGVDFVALEAHSGIKTLRRPTFHIRNGIAGFIKDNDRVLTLEGKPTKKSRGVGDSYRVNHLKDANLKNQRAIAEEWGVHGTTRTFATLGDFIQSLLLIALTESPEDILHYVRHILSQEKLWKKEVTLGGAPDGVVDMRKANSLDAIIKIAIDRTRASKSTRRENTRLFYESLSTIQQVLAIKAQLEKSKLRVDPGMLLEFCGVSGDLTKFLNADSVTITNEKQEKAEAKTKLKLTHTSGLGNNCLIYAILQTTDVVNGQPSHDQIAANIRQELVNRNLATQTSFLVNDQAVLDVIFGYLNLQGLYTQSVNIHFISVNGDEVIDDDQTWDRGGTHLYIFNDRNVHFSAML